MIETKRERQKRLNRERVSRHRLKKRLEEELQQSEDERGIYAIEDSKEATLELATQELTFIISECEAQGKPLWANKKFSEWEDKMDRLAKEGKLPKHRKTLPHL